MPDHPVQLTFPYPLEKDVFDTYLTQTFAIEDEYDRLREMQRQLDAEYKLHLPLRAMRTAIKVIRARRKLEHHAKEPMRREHQTYLEHMVEDYLRIHDLAHELHGAGVTLTVPDMPTGAAQT